MHLRPSWRPRFSGKSKVAKIDPLQGAVESVAWSGWILTWRADMLRTIISSCVVVCLSISASGMVPASDADLSKVMGMLTPAKCCNAFGGQLNCNANIPQQPNGLPREDCDA